MDITELVKVRKPTNNEQRLGKIVTSDYGISAVTIHSSVLKTLGWIDKVYRRKEVIVTHSNKNDIKKAQSLFNSFSKNATPYSQLSLVNNAKTHFKFVDYIEVNFFDSWIDVEMTIPTFIIDGNFKSPQSFIRTLNKARNFIALFDNLLEGLSDYKFERKKTIKELIPTFEEYFDKIVTDNVVKHTQTYIWEKAYEFQKQQEHLLGENFTPKQYALNSLDEWQRSNIKNEWNIDLTSYEGSWAELCDYLYSPKMIKEIRDKLGVKVRSRETNKVRKGVESNERKQFAKIIEKKRAICGADFNLNEEERKIKESEKALLIKETDYEEAKFILNHAIENNSEDVDKLTKAAETLRQRYSYAQRKHNRLIKNFNKKKDAYDIVKEYEFKQNLLNEMIEESREGEELSAFELEENLEAIRRQKAEEQIPYYTWRFVCDKIDAQTAQDIETALEEGLNKGSGVNGERGYINVTAFPMKRSYEFFVDYPKNSNLFRAFKAKGMMLSKILIEGVASHLHKSFVNCQGETFINSPMEKTMSGDMLDWIIG